MNPARRASFLSAAVALALACFVPTAVSRDVPSRELGGDVGAVNVRTFGGARGDGRRALVGTAIDAGSRTLSVAADIFSPEDVGKAIVVPGAGAVAETGAISSTPVASPGSGYSSPPKVAYRGGGSGAVGTPVMALRGATVVAGGTGCAEGVQRFEVQGGVGTKAVVSGAVRNGVLGGTVQVVTSGSYLSLPDAARIASGPAYGATCATAPRLALSFGLGSVLTSNTMNGGWAPGATASLSGGAPSVAAALGKPVVTLSTSPLVSTVTGYLGPRKVTLADAASTTLTNVVEQVFWASDDTAAIQASYDRARSTGRASVYFPAGTYWSSYASASVDPGPDSVDTRGDGMDATVLMWDPGTSLTVHSKGWKPFFAWGGKGVSALAGSYRFESLQFRGLFDEGRINEGGPALFGAYFAGVVLDRVKFTQISAMATQLEYAKRFGVTGSVFDTVVRDMARCRSCSNSVVTGNWFLHGDDDAVALHQYADISGPGTVREGDVVSDNFFEDVPGPHVLGARALVVADNNFRRAKVSCIQVAYDPMEGRNQQFAIDVHDNHCFDTMERPPFAGVSQRPIVVAPEPGRAGTTPVPSHGAVPGEPIRAYGTGVTPWAYRDAGGAASDALPMPSGIRVHDNLVARTLPAVARYSDWGYGPTLSDKGFVDPPVNEWSLLPWQCMVVPFFVVGMDVTLNQVSDCGETLAFSDISGSDHLASRWTISRNRFRNFSHVGIDFTGLTRRTTTEGEVSDNDLDGDPYMLSANRGLDAAGHVDGHWKEGEGEPWGMTDNSSRIVGLRIHRNAFRNVDTEVGSGIDRNANELLDNVSYAGVPTRLGPGQRGVGTIWRTGRDIRYVWIEADPTKADYGELVSMDTSTAGALPDAAKFWLPGTRVLDAAPTGHDAVAGNAAGWVRRTMGTGNVDGVDWGEIPLSLGGTLPVVALAGAGPPPTVAPGKAVPDAKATLDADSHDLDGSITFRTGSAGPGADVGLMTLRMGTSRKARPICSLSPANRAAADLSSAPYFEPTVSLADLVVRSGSSPLDRSTTYRWTYVCVN